MFGRIRCPRCNNRTRKSYAFCQHCGLNMRGGEKFFEPAFNLGFPFNAIFKQLEKQIEKEMRNLDRGIDRPLLDSDPMPLVQGLTIKIDSSNGNPMIKVTSMGDEKKKNPVPREAVGLRTMINDEKIRQMTSLPKMEPVTTVRRLADRIIYEIEMPGVEKDNILVTKLHNSIEIKAFSKDKAYFKLIPIALPIINSKLEEGRLILELKP